MAKKSGSFAQTVRTKKSKKIKKVSKTRDAQNTKRASYLEVIENAVRECKFSDDTGSKILTMIGSGGFCKSPLPSDLTVRKFLALHFNAELSRSALAMTSGRRCVKIEVFDDCCSSQVNAPKLHPKALRTRVKLFGTQSGAEMICSVRPFITTDAAANISQCGYGVRAIGYVGADFDPVAALKTSGAGKIFTTSAVPAPTISFVDPQESLAS